MKNKNIYFLLTGLLAIGLVINSCKKETQTSIPTLFTTGVWQLGSLQEYRFLGDVRLSLDTLVCDSAQIFAFNKDMTCTYTDFDCVGQTAAGTWELSDTKLYLKADMTCKDTVAAGESQPFANAHIVNIGDFSMVLETGDIQPFYNSTDKRTIRRYGFIRIKPIVTK